jgi:putative cell wall-binding protein
MKNKVMGKALSWVLSAAMALTMSGAIPAMTSTVYAAAGDDGIYFANNMSAYTVGTTELKFGKTTSDSETVPVAWNILSNTVSADKQNKAKVLNIAKTSASTSTSWLANTKAYFSATELGLFQATNIDTLGAHDYANQTVEGSVKATIHDPGVSSAQFYLPSAYEIDNTSGYIDGTLTRDTLTDVTGGGASGYVVAGAAAGPSIQLLTAANAGYQPVANLDLNDRTKALFVTISGTKMTAELTLIDSSVSTPDVKSADLTAGTGAVVTLKTAVPDGVSVGYFTADKAYTESDAVLGNVKTGAAVTISEDKKKVTVSDTALKAADVVYLYYYKTADDTVTSLASVPTELNNAGKATPSSSNFTIADISYTGNKITDAAGLTSLYATITPIVKAATGYTASGAAAVTVTGLKKGDTAVTASTASPLTLKAGDTYTVIGNVTTGWTETPTDSTKDTITYGTATGITLGTVTVDKKIIDLSNTFFTLPSIKQYSATSYKVASLALTNAAANTEISANDKVNAVNASVVLGDDATDAPASNVQAKVTISALDNANYTIKGTNYIKNDATVDVTAAAMTAAKIKDVPTTLTYVTGEDTINADGLSITATYEGGNTKTIIYDSTDVSSTQPFSFDPALTGTTLIADETVTVYYKDAASGTKFTCGTFTAKIVPSVVSLSKISIPATSTMAIDDIADMPSVSYYPSNTTDSREVTWSIVPGTGTAEFVNADGNTVGAWDAKTVVGIKALTAGTVTLTATPTVGGVAAASQTITIADKATSVYYERLSGDTRYLTAAAIAKQAFADETPDAAVLVSGMSFADALTASGFAGGLDLPILLTDTSALPDATKDLITGWGVKTIYIIGGTAVVTKDVETALTSAGVTTINRYAGDDRYETAKVVYLNGLTANSGSSIWGDSAVIATGLKAADALSISPWTYSKAMPIFLAGDNGVLDNSSLTIAKSFATTYLLGGTAVVNKDAETALKAVSGHTATRLAGDDRYETSVAIAKKFATNTSYYTSADHTTLASVSFYNNTAYASGLDAHYADALVGGMLQGRMETDVSDYFDANGQQAVLAIGAPILLVDGTSGAGFTLTTDELTKASANVSQLWILGGTAAVTTETQNAITGNWKTAKEGKA